MTDDQRIYAKDVSISIDGNKLFQAESAEIRKKAVLHSIRTCFSDKDVAHIRKSVVYKANLRCIVFKRPFSNCGFSDLDNFTMVLTTDRERITLSGCMWDDFYYTADREKFSEFISVTALDMKTEVVA